MKLLKIKYVKQFDRKPCNQADAAGLAILQFLAARGEGATGASHFGTYIKLKVDR
ncbi:hypothetical protein [Microcoleus vaginatus]|uniref:hypothetical protein n=1 Tax=Microcoleus vaginatus TaxID=119532 RepID=UPI0032ACCBD3